MAIDQKCASLHAGHLHHASSIAAAGMYEGVFREDMFDEAEGLDHPYFMTKHESEKIVRKESKVPWTVYRPALVVGESQTGEMDKIDGPYYFCKLIQRMRQILPPWMPSVGLEGGRINIVPVDFVVAALDPISHLKGDKAELNKKCFYLVDRNGYRVGYVLDIFSKAAHAPKMNLFMPRHVGGAESARASRARNCLTTPSGCGITGSGISIRPC